MITITKILDPFLPESNIIETKEYDINKKLYHYISDLPFDDEKIIFIISLNGNIIEYDKPQDLYIEIEDKSYISVCAKVGFTISTAIGAQAAIASGLAYGSLASMAVFWAATGATYLAIGYGVNQLLGALAPDIPKSYTKEQVYGWGTLTQTNLEGVTIPYVYGTNKMSGNVINQYIDVDQDDNEILCVMMGLCDNEVDSITDIRINDQASTYYEDITTDYRLGAADDTAIEGFNEIVAQEDIGIRLIYNTGRSYSTSDCEKMVIRVSAPNGIFYYDTDGRPSTLFAAYSVEYGESGSPTVFSTHSVVVCGPPDVILEGISYTRSVYDKYLDENITITNISYPKIDLSFFSGDIVIASNNFGVKFIFSDTLAQDNRQQFITDNLELFSSKIKSNLGDIDSKSYITDIDDLTLNQYDVRLRRLNPDWEDSGESSDIYFDSLQERIKQNLTYPGLAKYSVVALATDQISGGTPAFSCLVENSTVSVYNQDTFADENKLATNAAWIVYDLLVNKGGVSDDDIIWEEFKSWGTWLDDNSIVISGIVITESNYWAEVQRVAAMGRGAIIRRGVKYGVFIDKSDTTISHMFTSSGNIIKDSLTMTWLPKTDIANAIEIEYTDPDREYTRQVVSVVSEDYLTTDDTSSAKMSIKFDAAVTEDFVKAEGIFRMNCNKWLTKTISFDAYTDSFACTVGDLFYFQHDLPNYADGFSGRVVDAGNDNGNGLPYITLDKRITLDDTQTNKILIRLGDDTFVEKTLSIPAGDDYITLTVDSIFTDIPEKYDIYSVGSLESIKKTYRLISVDRRDDFSRTLVGLEYVDEVYTDRSGTIIDVPSFEIVPQEALNVRVKEILVYGRDGSYKSNVSVSWGSSLGDNTKHGWDIYLKNNTLNTNVAQIATNITKSSYLISDFPFSIDKQYLIYVVPESQGYNDTLNNGSGLTILGKLSPPSDVEDFEGTWDNINRVVTFTWTHVDEVDRDYYEIRELESASEEDWEDGEIVKKSIENATSIYIPNSLSGDRYYAIKAVDRGGISSESSSIIALTLNTSISSLDVPTGLTYQTASSIGADGTDQVYLYVYWDKLISEDLQGYSLYLTDTSVSSMSEYIITNNYYIFQPVKANTVYTLKVAGIDKGGNYTIYSDQLDMTSGVDLEAPSIPTSLSITEFFSGLRLSWSHGDEKDLLSFNIYRNTVDSFSTATLVGKNIGDFTSQISMYTDIPPTQDTYYYWVTAIDRSGNESDESTSINGSLTQIGNNDILKNAIDDSLLATELGARIDLVDTPTTGLIDSLAGEVTARGAADSILQGNINTLSGSVDGDISDILDDIGDLTTEIASLTDSVGDNTANITIEAGTRADDDGALAGRIDSLTTTVGVNTASIVSEAATRSNADSALALSINTLSTTVGSNTSDISNETIARTDADSALSSSISSLTTTVGSNTSAISDEVTTRSDADSALALSISTLTTTVGSNTSAISDETIARSDADNALALSISTLTTTVGSNTSAISNETIARTDADSALSSSISTLTTTVGGNTSAISDEVTTRSDADSALATSISSLTTTVGSNTSAISTETTTRSDADSALSTSISSLTTTVGSNTTSISETITSVDGVKGAYTVKIDNNGHVSGYGLVSELPTGSSGIPTSEFTVLVDKFMVVTPGDTATVPFIVGNVGGTSQVGINGELIVDGTIKADSIVANAITTDKIAADAVTATEIDVTNLSVVSESVGDLVIESGGSISSAKSSYTDTTDGLWFENYTGVGPRINIGGSTKYLKWTGSSLEVGGDIIATNNIVTNGVTSTVFVSVSDYHAEAYIAVTTLSPITIMISLVQSFSSTIKLRRNIGGGTWTDMWAEQPIAGSLAAKSTLYTPTTTGSYGFQITSSNTLNVNGASILLLETKR